MGYPETSLPLDERSLDCGKLCQGVAFMFPGELFVPFQQAVALEVPRGRKGSVSGYALGMRAASCSDDHPEGQAEILCMYGGPAVENYKFKPVYQSALPGFTVPALGIRLRSHEKAQPAGTAVPPAPTRVFLAKLKELLGRWISA